MNMIKLIATDMDGTLLNSRKEVPLDFPEFVSSHPNLQIVIASGRQYYTLRRDFAGISDKIIYIADNGGLVYHKEAIIHDDLMSRDDARSTLETILAIPGVVPIVCGVESAYMNPVGAVAEEQGHMYFERIKFPKGPEELLETCEYDRIIKIALYVYDARAEEVFNNFPALNPNVRAVLSDLSWIDIANATVNKGNAMKAIQKYLGVTREECMAFGDYCNDYEMFEACTETYCMANGHETMKALAKHMAPSNDENGVMQVLKKLFS